MKPPMTYFGGKGMLGPTIADLLPAHLHYVEPYCGSLAVLLAKPQSAMETVNDLDGDLMTFWRVLRDRTADLERACALTPHSRVEHRASHDLAGCDEVEVARRIWVQLTQGRTGTRRKTGWRHYVKPTGTTAFPDYLSGYLARMAPAAERLGRVSLESMPALDLIAKYGAERDVLLYVDPPYLSTARGWSGDGYVCEMKDAESHRELAAALRSARAAVVLSGYASDLYDLDLYPDWHRHAMVSGTGQGADGWQNRTEVLWSNRPIGRQPSLWDSLDGAA